jgi:hypothetical protein
MSLYMLAVSPGVTIPVFVDGGLDRNIEQMEDVGRSVGGTLLITQTGSTAGAFKEMVSCRTPPLTEAAATTAIAALRAAALLHVAIDTNTQLPADTPMRSGLTTFMVHPVIKSITPITAGGNRRWVITFDLLEN